MFHSISSVPLFCSSTSLASSPSSLHVGVHNISATPHIFSTTSTIPHLLLITLFLMTMTGSPSSVITFQYNMIAPTFFAIFTTTHLLLIPSFYNISIRLSFISYYLSIRSQPCYPHFLGNVYRHTSSDFFIL